VLSKRKYIGHPVNFGQIYKYFTIVQCIGMTRVLLERKQSRRITSGRKLLLALRESEEILAKADI
jgi:hypothetical protein